MYIVKKEGYFSTEYFKIIEKENSTSYAITNDESQAAKFSSESEAQTHLKKSGFNGISGLKIIEI